MMERRYNIKKIKNNENNTDMLIFSNKQNKQLYKIIFCDDIVFNEDMYVISIILYDPITDAFVCIKDSGIFFPYMSMNIVNNQSVKNDEDELQLKSINLKKKLIIEYYKLTGIYLNFILGGEIAITTNDLLYSGIDKIDTTNKADVNIICYFKDDPTNIKNDPTNIKNPVNNNIYTYVLFKSNIEIPFNSKKINDATYLLDKSMINFTSLQKTFDSTDPDTNTEIVIDGYSKIRFVKNTEAPILDPNLVKNESANVKNTEAPILYPNNFIILNYILNT